MYQDRLEFVERTIVGFKEYQDFVEIRLDDDTFIFINAKGIGSEGDPWIEIEVSS